MGVDAEHRALVIPGTITAPPGYLRDRGMEEASMGRGILLWLLGVPIPVIILLWLFFGH
jgi:hypothetical protein